MKPSLLHHLVCPVCAGPLSAEPFATQDNEIRQGILTCSGCRVYYPIYAFVPVLLIFPTPFHAEFARRHAGSLARVGLTPPSRRPEPGEDAVQEAFTDEWNAVQESELFRVHQAERFRKLNQQVWLKWLHAADAPRFVLDVGCGLGHEPVSLQDVIGGAEVFAVDLNFAIVRAQDEVKLRPKMHFVVASLFHLPFRKEAFDLVYSQGVLHHTYSTREAFRTLAGHVMPGGHYFVWLYALDDPDSAHQGTLDNLRLRAMRPIETVLRPVVSRTPRPVRDAFFAAAALALQPVARWRQHASWATRDTEHALRDWLAPRFAHRHTYNEVAEWFEGEGFEVIDLQSPAAYRRLFARPIGGVGMTGRKPTDPGLCGATAERP